MRGLCTMFLVYALCNESPCPSSNISVPIVWRLTSSSAQPRLSIQRDVRIYGNFRSSNKCSSDSAIKSSEVVRWVSPPLSKVNWPAQMSCRSCSLTYRIYNPFCIDIRRALGVQRGHTYVPSDGDRAQTSLIPVCQISLSISNKCV